MVPCEVGKELWGCFSGEFASASGIIPVSGAISGMIGLMEATEALKFLKGVETGGAGPALCFLQRVT